MIVLDWDIGGAPWIRQDARPGSVMEPELQEFHTGAAVHAYRTFGCHALPGAAGHRFAVWAPHAQRVALVGDFNGWDTAATPMDRLPDGTWCRP